MTVPLWSFATIVWSAVTLPGATVAYVEGLSTIWSMSAPSSRVWTRRRWRPAAAKRTVEGCASHHAPPCHPHEDTPHPEQFSRLTSNPDPVPIRHSGEPPAETASENCTQTDSLNLLS